jgi:hypothetical protein
VRLWFVASLVLFAADLALTASGGIAGGWLVPVLVPWVGGSVVGLLGWLVYRLLENATARRNVTGPADSDLGS